MKHKNFVVRLIYSYARNADEFISSEHSAIVAANMTAIKKTKKAATFTQKLINDANERASFENRTLNRKIALQFAHACKDFTCVNNDRYC